MPATVLWFIPLLGLLTYSAVEHFWLCDDAFISFRYAENAATGLGLVFNRLERVEGYSNFLWVLELATLRRAFDLSPAISSIVLSALASIAYVVVTGLLAAGNARARALLAAWVAIALVATNRNVAVWCTSGLETRQFSAFLLLGVWFASRYSDNPQRLAHAALFFAAAALTRPEGPLLWLGAVSWYLVDARLHARFEWRALARLVVPFVLIVGAHYLFRHWYYGDWLPNTYYAKHVRAWPDAGLHYLTALLCDSGLYLLIPLAVIGLTVQLLARHTTLHLLSAFLIVPYVAYVVNLGGDHFEFRPFDFAWPLLAVASADGILALGRFAGGLAARLGGVRRGAVEKAAIGVVATSALVYATVLQTTHDALTYQLRGRDESFRLHVPLTVENAPWAFVLPLLRETIVPVYNAARAFCRDHGIAVPWKEHAVFGQTQRQGYQAYGGKLFGKLPRDAVMAYPFAGIVPYFLRDLTVVDTLGLTDRVVARNQQELPRNRERALAHDRRPPPGYLEERGVNIEVWPAAATLSDALAAPFALRVEADLWMPFASSKPQWVQKAFAGKPLFALTLAPGAPSQSHGLVQGRAVTGQQLLGAFDAGSLEGWSLVGGNTPRESQPATAAQGVQGAIAGAVGGGFINSFLGETGDAATLELESPEFRADPWTWLAFRVGGGDAPGVAVELWADGRVSRSYRGKQSEQLISVLVNLSEYVGKSLRLRVIDRSDAPWGHVVADHFLLLR